MRQEALSDLLVSSYYLPQFFFATIVTIFDYFYLFVCLLSLLSMGTMILSYSLLYNLCAQNNVFKFFEE